MQHVLHQNSSAPILLNVSAVVKHYFACSWFPTIRYDKIKRNKFNVQVSQGSAASRLRLGGRLCSLFAVYFEIAVV